MAAIDWNSAKTALHAALPADPSNPIRIRGLALEAKLEQIGTIYDELFTGDVSDAKDTGFASAIATRLALLESVAGSVDHAAQVVEALQIDAQVGPFRYRGLSGKEAYPLAPSVDTPWDGSGSATATAQLVLQDGATDVLTLVAKDSGVWGNTVEATVAVSAGGTTTVWTTGSGAAGTYSVTTAVAGTVIEYDLDATPKITALRKVVPNTVYLVVRRGDYSERYQLRAGKPLEDLKGSLLLASAEWSDAATEPDAIGWTALAGGAGGALDAVKARAAKAAKLSAGAGKKRTLEALLLDLDGIITSTAAYPSTSATFAYTGRAAATEFEDAGTTYLVAGTNKGLSAALKPRQLSARQVEQRLQSIIDESDALHDLIV